MVDLIHDGTNELEHSYADVFDLARFLRGLLRGPTKSIRGHDRQFRVKAGGLSRFRRGPVDSAQENTDPPGTDGEDGRRTRADFATSAGGRHDDRIVRDAKNDAARG